MFENFDWAELLTAENAFYAAFFVSMFGPCLVALCVYIPRRLRPRKKKR